MLKLPNILSAWNMATFKQFLKSEIESLPAGSLPLEKGTTEGGYVDDSNISVTVLQTHDDEQYIQAKLGIFFTEIVAVAVVMTPCLKIPTARCRSKSTKPLLR